MGIVQALSTRHGPAFDMDVVKVALARCNFIGVAAPLFDPLNERNLTACPADWNYPTCAACCLQVWPKSWLEP